MPSSSVIITNNRSFHGTDQPYPAPNDAPEWERLDEMHQGINDYLGNQLSFAPINNPKRILEIGSGSGAWAIQAAQTYPEAEVLAIDISPLPPRPLPSNLKYEHINVALPFPFEPASFDVVHSRLVLCHLPHYQDVLKRIIELVMPGGWLLVEDIEHNLKGDAVPGIEKFYEIYHRYMARRDVDPVVGPMLEHLLKESGAFNEVHAKMIPAPFSGNHEDPALGVLGQVIKRSITRAYTDLDPKLVAFGLTKEIQDGFNREAEDPSLNVCTELFFTWARK